MVFTKDRNFYKKLIRLALPIALQSFVAFSISLSNNIMVGKLGDAATSGVYFSNQLQLLLQIINVGVEGAILVLVSQRLGAKDEDGARRAASLGIRISFLIALVFFALSFFFPSFMLSLFTNKSEIISAGVPYLRFLAISFLPFSLSQSLSSLVRSEGKPKIPLIASVIALAVNFILNYLLISGNFGFPRLEAVGAGISTLAARILEFTAIFVYSFFIDKRLKLKFSDFLKIDIDSLSYFVKIGFPIILSQLVWAVNTFYASALMGRLSGEGVVAGLSVANSLYNLTYTVTNGASGAVGIICGKLVGAGQSEKMREYSRTVQLIFVFLGILTAAVMQAFKMPFIKAWSVSSAAESYAIQFINVLSLLVIGTAYQSVCLTGLIKSGGDTAFVFKVEALSVFCVIIPLSTLASSLGALPWVVFLLLKCDQILKCPVAAIKLKKFKFEAPRVDRTLLKRKPAR